MGTIKLSCSTEFTSTVVSNCFIDEYMPSANGEFVKIYLYLLRALSSPDHDISVCHIADIFNHTEKDVLRALCYWEQVGLLELKFSRNKDLTDICLKPLMGDYITSDGTSIEVHPNTKSNASLKHIYTEANRNMTQKTAKESTHIAKGQEFVSTNDMENLFTPSIDNGRTVLKDSSYQVNLTSNELKGSDNVSPSYGVLATPSKREKKTYTSNELDAFKSKEDVEEFLYLAQKYIGKTLSGADVNSLLFIYDVLEFEPDLIEYLIEYCVTNGHKSVRYMEKVAISWADEGISDVRTAKANTTLYSKSCYPVLKAFGISGRNPGEGEKALIIKWTNKFGFSMDIILDACNRTMNTIHQPSFEYADSILTKWNQKGIHTLSDIKALDDEHIKNKALHPGKNTTPISTDNKTANAKPKNSFNDFTQRTYNYEALEKELLGNI